ncbi:MAG: iron ABC transporter permease, partial [Alphaproteobacteria bacterium]
MTRAATETPAPMPARRHSPAWAWGSMLVACAIATPILAVLVTAAAPGGEVWRHILATTLPGMLASSALLALLVAVMAGSAGAITAWLVVACEFRGRRFLEVALLLPIAMPAYLCGYVYTWLLDVAGPVQTTLRAATGLSYGQY